MVVEHGTGLRMKVVFHFFWVEREATTAGEGAQTRGRAIGKDGGSQGEGW